ncbi:MAG: 5-oxoprolinase subunit PxpA [Akkermansiaceae bacterium]
MLRLVMEINADVGEMMGDDAGIMGCISMGNVACGGHASDVEHMGETVRLAVEHGVRVCAHPGYRDRENFGRVSVVLSGDEILELVGEQVGLLKGICEDEGVGLFAIKPHGALYHDMMQGGVVRDVMLEVAREFGVPLVVQAGVDVDFGEEVEIMREGFADRGYSADGGLMARSEEGALHIDAEVILAQARQMIDKGVVRCNNGSYLHLSADTLCFHGDNPASVAALKRLYA